MFRTKKVLLTLAALLVFMFVIAACGVNQPAETATEQNKEVSDEQSNAAKQQSEEEPAAAEEEAVRVIEHAMGTTEITGTPQRVVTLYQGATDVAVALGVKPVGAVESWLEQPFYIYLRDHLDGVPVVGQEPQPNLEEIAKLNPDLIIASKLRHEEVYEQLSQIAPTVTHETVYKFKDTVDLLGKALNKEEEAKALLAEWDDRVADFKGKISAKLGDQWPIKVSVLNFRADHARIYVTGFAGDILEELGFTRSEYLQQEAENGSVVIRLTDKESIPSMNADVSFVFLTDPGEDEAVQKTYEEWTSHPLWQSLDSVKAEQVYQIDEVAWNMGGGLVAAKTMLDQLYEHFQLEK